MDVMEKNEAASELLSELSKCRRCRFCFDACPVYEVSERVETMSAYGRLQVLRLLLTGVLNIDDTTVYPLYTCLQCGNCTLVCKAKGQNLEVAELIRAGKSIVTSNLLKRSGK